MRGGSCGSCSGRLGRTPHHGAVESVELLGPECLGQGVGDHEHRGDVAEYDSLSFDVLADEVVADVDVARSVVGNLSEGKPDGALVVLEEYGGRVRRDAKFGEPVSRRNDLLDPRAS